MINMNYIHTIYVMYIQIVWMDMDGDGNIWMDIQVFKRLGNTNASAQEIPRASQHINVAMERFKQLDSIVLFLFFFRWFTSINRSYEPRTGPHHGWIVQWGAYEPKCWISWVQTPVSIPGIAWDDGHILGMSHWYVFTITN